MNWDRIEGNWKQVRGAIREKWGELTDDEFDLIAGGREKLAGTIQAYYGYSAEEAEMHAKRLERKFRNSSLH